MKTRRKQLKGVGRIYLTDGLEDGKGIRVARDFLDSVMMNFSRECIKYYDYTSDHAFAYGERQLHSVLFPAIRQRTERAFAELPITRKPHGLDSSSGRVDYRVHLRRTVILLEVKHAWHAATSPRLRESSRRKWKSVVKQVKSVRVPEVRKQALKTKDKLLVIGLLFVPTWIGRGSADRLKPLIYRTDDKIFDDYITIMKTLGGAAPSWSACFVVPSQMRIQPYEGNHEAHFAINAFAYRSVSTA